jgi:hypothetical protein
MTILTLVLLVKLALYDSLSSSFRAKRSCGFDNEVCALLRFAQHGGMALLEPRARSHRLLVLGPFAQTCAVLLLAGLCLQSQPGTMLVRPSILSTRALHPRPETWRLFSELLDPTFGFRGGEVVAE